MSVLLTPGPLTTDQTIRNACPYDMGSHENKFIDILNNIRGNLLEIANLKATKYDSILMQGCGTMGIESVINSTIPSTGKILIIRNGAYGDRIKNICIKNNLKYICLDYEWDTSVNVEDVKKILIENPDITVVTLVHSETTTGILNNLQEVGQIVKDHNSNISYIVDAMSSFGGIPIDVEKSNINYLISSSNKCIEGLPGFSFIIANTEHLKEEGNHARTLSLDLKAQWEQFRKNGEFRFTPPVQSLLSFNRALKELKMEGVDTRHKRYIERQQTISNNMEEIGFRPYLRKEVQGPIITTFRNPIDFNFEEFYNNLCKEGYVIYSGKVVKENTFRIGNIGHIQKSDIYGLKLGVKRVLKNMKYIIKY